MKNLVCNYAPICFMPDRETGEFINIGIAVYSPQRNILAYYCGEEALKRVAQIFPRYNPKILQAALRGLKEDLEAHSASLINLERFKELVRRREGILYFGPIKTYLAEDLSAAVQHLYTRQTSGLASAIN